MTHHNQGALSKNKNLGGQKAVEHIQSTEIILYPSIQYFESGGEGLRSTDW